MNLKKSIKNAYKEVHAPEDLTERIKSEFYQKDFDEDSDFDDYQEDIPQRPAFLKYIVYIAAMTALCIGCVSALNYMEQFRTDFRPASRVGGNPPVSDISEPPLTTVDENGENATVPNVAGYHFEYATKILNQCGFETQNVYEFSDYMQATNVISVTWNGEDVADQSVPIGATLELHISKGSQDDPEIPDLHGMTAEWAKTLLEYYGLNVELTFEESEEPIAGQVIAQSIDPSTKATAGDTIILTIAKNSQTAGSSSMADENAETATIPDVLGYHVEFVLNLLHDAGFQTQVYYEHSEMAKNGVFSMTLDGEEITGKTAPIGARIALHVSDVPDTVNGIPDFLGMEEAQAKELCESLGLMVKTEEDESIEPAGTVIAQSLEAGTIIQQGMLNTLIISSE